MLARTLSLWIDDTQAVLTSLSHHSERLLTLRQKAQSLFPCHSFSADGDFLRRGKQFIN